MSIMPHFCKINPIRVRVQSPKTSVGEGGNIPLSKNSHFLSSSHLGYTVFTPASRQGTYTLDLGK